MEVTYSKLVKCTCQKNRTWSRQRSLSDLKPRRLRRQRLAIQYHLLQTNRSNVSSLKISWSRWLSDSWLGCSLTFYLTGQYWVARKRRYCHLPSKKTNKYCGEHLTEQQKEDIAQDTRVRIPCPFDPRQYVFTIKDTLYRFALSLTLVETALFFKMNLRCTWKVVAMLVQNPVIHGILSMSTVPFHFPRKSLNSSNQSTLISIWKPNHGSLVYSFMNYPKRNFEIWFWRSSVFTKKLYHPSKQRSTFTHLWRRDGKFFVLTCCALSKIRKCLVTYIQPVELRSNFISMLINRWEE